MEITRRNMLKGFAVGAVGALGGTMIAGCAPAPTSVGSATEASEKNDGSDMDYASQVIESHECDIVVVGAGISGFAAGVQATLDGAKVILVESQKEEGGNGAYTDGIGAVQSEAQKAGIINSNMKTPGYAVILNPGERPTKTDYTPLDILKGELEVYQDDLDGERWYDLLVRSGGNIEWLKEQGVELMEGVDNYTGEQRVNTSHWWAAGLGGGLESYIKPMSARFQELGGTLMCATKAVQVVIDDSGSACGIYASTDDGIVEIDSKAVILATGGFNDNPEMLASIGINPEKLGKFTAPAGHDGDGINMALALGAKSWMHRACLLQWPMNDQMGIDSSIMCTVPFAVWINDNGSRFADESCPMRRGDRGSAVLLNQRVAWTVMDQPIFDKLCEAREDIAQYVQKCLDAGALVKADSLEAMASGMEVDPAVLKETIASYNDDCAAGVDTRFGKDSSHLVPVAEAPFYYIQSNGVYTVSSAGGIGTTIDGEVRTADGEGTIPDLYAVGMDGCELWRDFYNIKVPSFANSNNVNTGRRAAIKACAKL